VHFPIKSGDIVEDGVGYIECIGIGLCVQLERRLVSSKGVGSFPVGKLLVTIFYGNSWRRSKVNYGITRCGSNERIAGERRNS
jgi:hypothetical protein